MCVEFFFCLKMKERACFFVVKAFSLTTLPPKSLSFFGETCEIQMDKFLPVALLSGFGLFLLFTHFGLKFLLLGQNRPLQLFLLGLEVLLAHPRPIISLAKAGQ